MTSETQDRPLEPRDASHEMRLVLWMSLANILSLLGLQAFPSLLPGFIDLWQLTNTQAGWLNGIYFFGYMLAVPLLLPLTDVVDARTVYLWASAISFFSLAGFVLYADGFWSALLFRTFQGVGYAGCYMPGLKVLTDRSMADNPSRGIALYTSSYLLAGSLSIYLSGELGRMYGWQFPFWGVALGAAGAFLIVWLATAYQQPPPRNVGTHLLDFRPVFRQRTSLGYMVGYAMHNWELMGSISWTVTFLTAALAWQAPGQGDWNVTAVAALLTLSSFPASVIGNELAIRFGRRNTAVAVMLVSGIIGVASGFSVLLPFQVILLLRVLYGITTTGESAIVTAGAIMSVPPYMRGSAMAVHSAAGFLGASLGPLGFGIALDLFGGRQTMLAWGMAHVVSSLGVVLGAMVVWWLVAGKQYERPDSSRRS